jgi:hypothetical protein
MDAIGIIRVSRVAGRDGESFVSPTEQRQRIEAECKRAGFTARGCRGGLGPKPDRPYFSHFAGNALESPNEI